MRVAIAQLVSWDRFYAYDLGGSEVKLGDYIIVNSEFGVDAARVSEVREIENDSKSEFGEIGTVERKANRDDLDSISNDNKQKEGTINYCHKLVKKEGLEMKVVDCYYSFDGQRLTFAFIADGRVDFRNLVKELNRHFQKSIRLFQLGVRDEAKIAGDIGCCGINQCCKSHLKKLGNVTSEFAEHQQVAHRGSERLSGICGRLKCCLAYENDLYLELAKELPPIGTRVRTKHGRGEVIGWHVLTKSVKVKIDPDKEGVKNLIVEVPINPEKKEEEESK